jgi:hypothetical protein
MHSTVTPAWDSPCLTLNFCFFRGLVRTFVIGLLLLGDYQVIEASIEISLQC